MGSRASEPKIDAPPVTAPTEALDSPAQQETEIETDLDESLTEDEVFENEEKGKQGTGIVVCGPNIGGYDDADPGIVREQKCIPEDGHQSSPIVTASLTAGDRPHGHQEMVTSDISPQVIDSKEGSLVTIGEPLVTIDDENEDRSP